MLQTCDVGDFFTTKTGGFMGRVIRVVTRSEVNHAGVIVSREGLILESRPLDGASWGNIKNYPNAHIHRVLMSDQQRVLFQEAAKSQLGKPYNFLDILCVGFLQFGIRPKFLRKRVAQQDSAICSQLVDRIELLAGIHLFNDERIEQDVTPGDLDRLPLIVKNQGVSV